MIKINNVKNQICLFCRRSTESLVDLGDEDDFELFESAWNETFGSDGGWDGLLRQKRSFDDAVLKSAPELVASSDFYHKKDQFLVTKVLGSLDKAFPSG